MIAGIRQRGLCEMSQELKGQSPKGLRLLSKTVGHGGRLPVLLLMAVKHGSYMDLGNGESGYRLWVIAF